MSEPGGPRESRRRLGGIAVIVVSVLGALWFGLLALLSANPCGAFGDACDDVGGTGDGFGWFVMSVVLCLVGVVAGVMMIESARSD